MDDTGHCPVCGRPRTTTPTGAPVSCCPRWLTERGDVPPPERAGTFRSALVDIRAAWDAWSDRRISGSVWGAGCLVVVLAVVASVVAIALVLNVRW